MTALQPLVSQDVAPPGVIEEKLRNVQELLLETHLLDKMTDQQEEMIRLIRIAFTEDAAYQIGIPPLTELRKGWFFLGFSLPRSRKLYVLAFVGTTAKNVQFRVWGKANAASPTTLEGWKAFLLEGEGQFHDTDGPFAEVLGHGVENLVRRLEQSAGFL
jgi:hypothetical protein